MEEEEGEKKSLHAGVKLSLSFHKKTPDYKHPLFWPFPNENPLPCVSMHYESSTTVRLQHRSDFCHTACASLTIPAVAHQTSLRKLSNIAILSAGP